MEEITTFKKGDHVIHPGKPEWGPGVVTEDPQDDKVRVLFVEGGEKLLLLRHARLEKHPAGMLVHLYTTFAKLRHTLTPRR